MRRLLFVLFLLFVASPPTAMAQVKPYAQYNPATGDIRILECDKAPAIYFGSKSGLNQHPMVWRLPLETTPPGATGFEIAWTPKGVEYVSLSGRGLPFTSLIVRGAFLPGTPISDVVYADTYRGNLRFGTVFQVPEPSTLAVGSTSLLALAALRRRKTPTPFRG